MFNNNITLVPYIISHNIAQYVIISGKMYDYSYQMMHY